VLLLIIELIALPDGGVVFPLLGGIPSGIYVSRTLHTRPAQRDLRTILM